MIRNKTALLMFQITTCLAFPYIAWQPAPVSAAEPKGTRIVSGASIQLLKVWPEVAAAPKGKLETFECLIKPDDATLRRTRAFVIVLSNRSGRDTAGIGVAIHQGVVYCNVLGTKLQATKPLPVGKWSHIALTINTRTINKVASLWVNGKLVAEELVLEIWPRTFEVAEMLSDRWSQGRVFTGELGDVRFSSVVRYTAPFEPADALKKDNKTVLILEAGRVPAEK